MSNPYQPPSPAANAPGPAPRDPALAEPTRSEAPRWLAVLVTFLAGLPLLGVGHLVLGRGRRALVWIAAGLTVWAMMIAGVWLPAPKLFLIAMPVTGIVWVAALIATGRAAAGRRMATRQAGWLAVAVLVLGMVLAQAQRRWWIEAFQMPAGSMMPSLLPGDHFFSAKGRTAERGDVIVFGYPLDPEVDYCKRVLAVGGDVVEFKENVVFVNGQPLARTEMNGPCPDEGESAPGRGCTLFEERNGRHRYRILLDGAATLSSFSPHTVPPGHVFVVGDNRDNSNDSRVWGTVPLDLVKARPRFVIWSRRGDKVRWDRIGTVVD